MDVFEMFEDILSDDEDDIIINIVENPRRPRVFRRRVDTMEIWIDQEFINRFRISKASVEVLLQQIGIHLHRNTQQNHALSPLTQILVALRFFATGSMLIVAADFGGIDTSTTSRLVRDVSREIAILARIYIQMPRTNQEVEQTKNDFQNLANFPNVIGAVDCTHIRIQSPGGPNAENFRNRKGYFSINVQTVSDANLYIRNIVARWPGSTNDRVIYGNSRLKAQLNGGIYGNSFILGDSGYTLDNHIMIPVTNPITPAAHLYNESQIRTRNVVERQYGIWKRRFQILRLELRVKLETTLAIIVATGVLHNLALDRNDPEPQEDNFIEEDNNEENVEEQAQGDGVQIRQDLINNYFTNLL